MKIINIRNTTIVTAIFFTILNFLSGCGQKSAFETADGYSRKSQDYYERAVKSYKDLISKNKDSASAHFELGRLYYNHGDYRQAVEQLKGSGFAQAKKLLAVSYYQLGDFTDALEVFNSVKNPDDESRYYYGLTCEKLNLYDLALEAYKKINSAQFVSLAQEHINAIEKQVRPSLIKDIDPETDKIIRSSASAEEYPQAGALFLSCDEKIEITADDKQVSYMRYLIKILNERGKQDFSEVHIDYDSTYEKVELEYARTIKPDGTVIDVGRRHMRDVSKYLNFPLYSNARVFIISFPEIVEDAVIEYKLKIYRNQLINKNDFVLDYPVQTQEPIIAADFILDLPENKFLHIKTINEKYNNFNAELKPLLQKKNGRLIYQWHFKNIPQIIPEANMPPAVEINPGILFSSFNSWQEIYDWWWQLARDKIRADSSIKDKVRELTGGLNSEEEKIRAIYNFCAQKIRYVAVEYGQAGYEPHKAEDIFKNKYGDCKDQAILLVTMLRQAGIKSFPVLIPTKEYYDLNEDFPAVLFNHCIAAVFHQEKIVFLDPTAETCPFGDLPGGDQVRRVLLVKDDGYEIQSTPLYPAEHNLVKQNIRIKIKDDGSLEAKKSISTYGVYDQAQRYWLLYTPPKLIEEGLKERIQEVSIGAKLENYLIDNLNNLNQPVVLSYEFSGQEYFTEAGFLRIVPQLAGVDTRLVAKNRRDYPIDFNILDKREIVYEIEIPRGYTVKYMPDTVIEDSKWINFKAQYKQKDDKLFFSQEVEAKSSIVLQDQYADFKEFFERLAKKVKQRIVLGKKK